MDPNLLLKGRAQVVNFSTLPYTSPMLRDIAPVFFSTDLPATLAYYSATLGFALTGGWQDPPIYAIVTRDHQSIHFRCAPPPTPNPDKYVDEFLDAYLSVDDIDSLHAEYTANNVRIARPLADTPWNTREFVIRDCDGRLLAFGSSL